MTRSNHPSERELRRTRKQVGVALARANIREERDALLRRYCRLVLTHGAATSASHVHREQVKCDAAEAGVRVEMLSARYEHLPLERRKDYERRAEALRSAARALRRDVPARVLRACAIMTALVSALIVVALLLR